MLLNPSPLKILPKNFPRNNIFTEAVALTLKNSNSVKFDKFAQRKLVTESFYSNGTGMPETLSKKDPIKSILIQVLGNSCEQLLLFLKGVRKKFAKFTGKHLVLDGFLIKLYAAGLPGLILEKKNTCPVKQKRPRLLQKIRACVPDKRATKSNYGHN